MRLQTECRIWLLAALLPLFAVRASAYSVFGAFPIQEALINTGEYTTTNLLGNQAKELVALNVAVAPVNYETSKLKNWETKYYTYLQDASYMMSSLQASSTIYTQAYETFRNLYELVRSMHDNPQGVVSTAAINNLYITTAVKFLKVFRLIKYTITKSGRASMLNGSERCQLLWRISGDLDDLNHDIRRLSLSVRYYSLLDVWMNAILPYGIVNHKAVADYCFNKWKRNYRQYAKYCRSGWKGGYKSYVANTEDNS